MRFRAHLTYANVMATAAVFGVLAGGGAYAASKIDTPDIASKAVTAKKLDSGAVKTSKLRSGAVTGDKLADGAVEPSNLSEAATPAVAGVVVYNGQVRGWFNRFSGAKPVLEHPQAGVYHLFIPGIDGTQLNFNRLVASVSLTGTSVAPPGEISTRWTASSGCCDLHPIIFTFDSGGNPVDHDFTYLLYRGDDFVL